MHSRDYTLGPDRRIDQLAQNIDRLKIRSPQLVVRISRRNEGDRSLLDRN